MPVVLALIGLVVTSVFGFVITERTVERAVEKGVADDFLPSPGKTMDTVQLVAIAAGLFLILGGLKK